MIEIDARSTPALLVCTVCKSSEPLPFPVSVASLSAIVRDMRFRHATCR